MKATRQQLPHLLTCRDPMLTWQASRALGMSLIYRRANHHVKPAFEAALLSWRSDHETALKHLQGRVLVLPLKRTTQRRTIKSLGQMASLAEMPHNQNRIHDGQEWPALGHSLPEANQVRS